MSDSLFNQYWWLLFPLGWFVFGAWQSWLSYRANQETLDLIKTYAASGREPPPELLSRLNKRWHGEQDDDDRPRYRRRRERSWYQVVLFGLLACGFTVAAANDMFGAGEAFVIVAFVLGSLCLATLVQVVLDQKGPTL